METYVMGLDPFGVASRFWLRFLFNHEDSSSSFPVPVYQMRLRPFPRRQLYSGLWAVMALLLRLARADLSYCVVVGSGFVCFN